MKRTGSPFIEVIDAYYLSFCVEEEMRRCKRTPREATIEMIFTYFYFDHIMNMLQCWVILSYWQHSNEFTDNRVAIHLLLSKH